MAARCKALAENVYPLQREAFAKATVAAKKRMLYWLVPECVLEPVLR